MTLWKERQQFLMKAENRAMVKAATAEKKKKRDEWRKKRADLRKQEGTSRAVSRTFTFCSFVTVKKNEFVYESHALPPWYYGLRINSNTQKDVSHNFQALLKIMGDEQIKDDDK